MRGDLTPDHYTAAAGEIRARWERGESINLVEEAPEADSDVDEWLKDRDRAPSRVLAAGRNRRHLR